MSTRIDLSELLATPEGVQRIAAALGPQCPIRREDSMIVTDTPGHPKGRRDGNKLRSAVLALRCHNCGVSYPDGTSKCGLGCGSADLRPITKPVDLHVALEHRRIQQGSLARFFSMSSTGTESPGPR